MYEMCTPDNSTDEYINNPSIFCFYTKNPIKFIVFKKRQYLHAYSSIYVHILVCTQHVSRVSYIRCFNIFMDEVISALCYASSCFSIRNCFSHHKYNFIRICMQSRSFECGKNAIGDQCVIQLNEK